MNVMVYPRSRTEASQFSRAGVSQNPISETQSRIFEQRVTFPTSTDSQATSAKIKIAANHNAVSQTVSTLAPRLSRNRAAQPSLAVEIAPLC